MNLRDKIRNAYWKILHDNFGIYPPIPKEMMEWDTIIAESDYIKDLKRREE